MPKPMGCFTWGWSIRFFDTTNATKKGNTLRLWLEQKKSNPEGKSCSVLRLPPIHCSSEQKNELEKIAKSRTLGIWRMKRAKVILGALEGKTLERLVLDVRVPPETIVKCVEAFSKQGTGSLRNPTRKPTQRETRVEKMLEMLETPSKQKGREWRYFTVRYIGIDFTGPMIEGIRALSVSGPGVTRVELSRMVCREFGFGLGFNFAHHHFFEYRISNKEC